MHTDTFHACSCSDIIYVYMCTCIFEITCVVFIHLVYTKLCLSFENNYSSMYDAAVFVFLFYLQFIIDDLLPYLGDTNSPLHRQGAIETIACIPTTPPHPHPSPHTHSHLTNSEKDKQHNTNPKSCFLEV